MKEWDWLSRHPVIRFNEVARHFGSRAYARLFVHRMAKAGRIQRITKGAYTTTDNIFAIASNLHYPSYISFLSASYLWGITEQIPIRVYVATAKAHPPIDIMGYKIEFVPIKHVWGYHKEMQGNAEVFIADIEKLMLDAFLKPEYMGNFEEIEGIFSNSQEIDMERLKKYVLKAGGQRIYRQVGYMLQKHKGIDISGWIKIDRNYYSPNPFQPCKKTDKKWRLKI